MWAFMVAFIRIAFIILCAAMLLKLLACDMSQVDHAAKAAFTKDELNSLDFKLEVALLKNKGLPCLEFKESFVMPRERLLLKLPDVFLREEKLVNRMRDLTVSTGGKLTPVGNNGSAMLVESQVGRRLTLSYLYYPYDPAQEEPAQDSFSAPIIREDYFQFVGLMALVYPVALLHAEPFSVTLDWKIPKDFYLFNSFAGQKLTHRVTTDFDKLRDAFFVAGNNIRAYKATVRNQPVYITFEGDFDQITDEQFMNTVTRLLDKQRETWSDDNFPYFLIHIMSSQSDCHERVNFAGTAHPNSFRAFFPSGCALFPDMKQLISHELMHMWIGKIIKVGEKRGHIDGKWFTEGFADYFGRVLAYRAGVLTQDEYFASLNRQLAKYFSNRHRTLPLTALVSQMYKRGRSSRALEDVPYQQGEIMALRLNHQILSASKFTDSLDDVIRDMLNEAKKSNGSKNFTVEEIAAIIDRYSLNALAEEFAKVKTGKLFNVPELTGCRLLRTTPYPQYVVEHGSDRNHFTSHGQFTKACDQWLQ